MWVRGNSTDPGIRYLEGTNLHNGSYITFVKHNYTYKVRTIPSVLKVYSEDYMRQAWHIRPQIYELWGAVTDGLKNEYKGENMGTGTGAQGEV